jgi:seryl-tRNA synthetase
MHQFIPITKSAVKCVVMLSAAVAFSSRSGGIGVASAFSGPGAIGRTAAAAARRGPFSFLLPSTASADADTTDAGTPVLANKRLSRVALPSSLDARSLSANLDIVLSHLASRRASEDTLDAARSISALNSGRVSWIKKRDEALQKRNEFSGQVGKLMGKSKGEETDEIARLKEDASRAGEEANAVEIELNEIESKIDAMLASLPNLLDDSVPDGASDDENDLVHQWGDVTALPTELGWTDDFEPLWHDDVATNLGGWNADAAVGMSGARFVSLTGSVARLERAISSYFLDRASEKGYIEVSPPLVVSRSALEGTSQLPKFEEDLFKIVRESHTCNGEDAFLIPTAEVPLTNMHSNQILDESDLPLSYCALTPCFRAEAGSYGRDTRGLIRTHQFYKVELVKITTPGSSNDEHHKLTRHAEECLEELKIPYRRMRLCSGDIGFSAQLCYDLEAWLPSTKEYREISSCSNTGDFQARRMALRFRPVDAKLEESEAAPKEGNTKKAKKPKPAFCHTINGSGLAVGRTLVAVLENYQTPSGDVVVPDVLRKYMGGLEILKKK